MFSSETLLLSTGHHGVTFQKIVVCFEYIYCFTGKGLLLRTAVSAGLLMEAYLQTFLI
jgi:hypothetical protein